MYNWTVTKKIRVCKVSRCPYVRREDCSRKKSRCRWHDRQCLCIEIASDRGLVMLHCTANGVKDGCVFHSTPPPHRKNISKEIPSAAALCSTVCRRRRVKTLMTTSTKPNSKLTSVAGRSAVGCRRLKTIHRYHNSHR